MAARTHLRLGIRFFNTSLKDVSSLSLPIAPRKGVRIQRDDFSIRFRSRIHTSTLSNVQYKRFGERSKEEERLPEVSNFPSRFPSTSKNEKYQEVPLWKRIAIQQGQQFPRRKKGRIVGRIDPFGRIGIVLIILVGGGLFYIFHLEKIPDTGRWRFLYVSLEEERKMADEAFHEIVKYNQNRILPSNDPTSQYVSRIASKIIQAASIQRQEGNLIANHLSDSLHHGLQNHSFSTSTTKSQNKVNWQVFVIKDDKPNAFVLPNGKIFVNTGILPICKDEDGLATVLGHEVAHQLVRHSAEKISNSNFLIILSYTVNWILGINLNLSHSALQLLIALPNSRTCESEADHIGLRLMSSACFDPTKAPNIWKRMQEMEKESGHSIFGSILSTHPLSQKREAKLKEWIPEADRIRQDSNCPNPATISSFKENVPALYHRSSGLFPINRTLP